MQKDMLFMAVIEALSRDECAVRRLSLDGVRRYLDSFLYERVNDPWTGRRWFSRAATVRSTPGNSPTPTGW